VTARAYINRNRENSKWHKFIKASKYTIQTIEAENLMTLAGLSEHTDPCTVSEIEKIQNVLPDYKIKILSKEVNYTLIYEGI